MKPMASNMATMEAAPLLAATTKARKAKAWAQVAAAEEEPEQAVEVVASSTSPQTVEAMATLKPTRDKEASLKAQSQTTVVAMAATHLRAAKTESPAHTIISTIRRIWASKGMAAAKVEGIAGRRIHPLNKSARAKRITTVSTSHLSLEI